LGQSGPSAADGRGGDQRQRRADGGAGWPARAATLPARQGERQGCALARFGLQIGRFQPPGRPPGAPARRGPCDGPLGSIGAAPQYGTRRRDRLSASDPNYNPATDTYRQIYRGHDNASAVTNTEGLTVYFDPDTHEVLGFSIASFSVYYESHKTPEGDFEVSLPKRVPANLEEEMDFDAEALRSGVRIAEFY
jgi:hypothetical protein